MSADETRVTSYQEAGVDINAADRAVSLIKKAARATQGPAVLGGIGAFSSLFELKGYRQPVLAASCDGVGTKLMVAILAGRSRSIGGDLVNLCVNDIITCGAEPLFFLDYYATGKLKPEVVAEVVQGMAEACREAGCALVGGETAEMPGLYHRDDFDLAGFVVGVVEKDSIIDGSSIREGDVLVGIPSNGLHTNGFALVRKVFGVGLAEDEDGKAKEREFLDRHYPELGRTLGEELLQPHRCYWLLLRPHLSVIKGVAHITGGGLVENVPRVLPEGLAARFHSGSWPVPLIFSLIQQRGVPEAEMRRTFNMGLGMVLACAPENADQLCRGIEGAVRVGEVVRRSEGGVEFV